jgi:hypothetical protein
LFQIGGKTMGKIEVILDNQKFYMNKSNAATSLEVIAKALVPWIPIFEESSGFNEACGIENHVQGHFFLSSGLLTDKKEFGVMPNSRNNYVYLDFSHKADNYKIIDNGSEIIGKLTLPFVELASPLPGINEGLRGGGTKRLIIGNSVELFYPKELNALKFAQDSIPVNIPRKYSMPGDILGLSLNEELKEKINYVNEIASMKSLINLIECSMEESGRNNSRWPLLFSKVSDLAFNNGANIDNFKKQFFVDDSDNIITISNRGSRNAIAAVKLNKGTFYGDIFVKPLAYQEVIRIALSQESVQKFYPMR